MEAELWQGHPKHAEGWETTIYLTYGASVVLLTLALGFAPETSIQTWASAEARARLDLKDKGVEIEFGKHYSAPHMKYDYNSTIAENPFNEEDDDDDDEEEGEEEEVEEEEDEDDDDE